MNPYDVSLISGDKMAGGGDNLIDCTKNFKRKYGMTLHISPKLTPRHLCRFTREACAIFLFSDLSL
jgi:hypothetical protein